MNESSLPKTSVTPRHACCLWNVSHLSLAHSLCHCVQDDMHRVIDQQLMDKHQDEWLEAPSSLSGSCKAHGGQSSRRAHRISDRDKRLFSFFKKNWAPFDRAWAQQTERNTGVTGETTQPKMGRGTHWGLGGGSFCTLSVPLLFSLVANWRLLIVGDFGIGLSQRLWPQPPHRKHTEHKQGP